MPFSHRKPLSKGKKSKVICIEIPRMHFDQETDFPPFSQLSALEITPVQGKVWQGGDSVLSLPEGPPEPAPLFAITNSLSKNHLANNSYLALPSSL